ncbi:glycine-rich RNA-binding protein 2, mitochondrial-like [Lolium perenne]|uniref:glycine-rich RNA-binding protein 2, mitochondrial-like n=1 Tax=Lolium perenne TaxID=4522 RepID=UPI0021F51B49|nr:glycine-rich RNA-binding protein 2, mitochondrial-like [Lolium perenne]XP_051188706.1 glycine-rich RNA-binding protein 2, mitochondrial-like [Lolium perenne]XP_051188707.1 glycine-rich RNA-binding protein 2, mitochondrial-like [Lolium perenne]
MFTTGTRAVPHAVPFVRLLDRSAAFSSCSKLFVGGLSYDTNEIALKDAFSQHGDVVQVKVICHPLTGRSKGYGFVKFSSEVEAAAALEKMSHEVLDGRNIRLHYANHG